MELLNLHLVNPTLFSNLGFTEKLQVGTTALILTVILTGIGFAIVKSIGLPNFSGYHSTTENVFSFLGIGSILAGIGIALSYLMFFAFVGIVCGIVYGIVHSL
ncbi:hypothetical protein ACVTYA_05830 [Enterococcus hirae]